MIPKGSWSALLRRGGYEVEGEKAACVAARPDSNAAWSRRPSVARRLTVGDPARGRIENTVGEVPDAGVTEAAGGAAPGETAGCGAAPGETAGGGTAGDSGGGADWYSARRRSSAARRASRLRKA